MFSFKRNIPFYQKKKFYIPMAVFLVLVVARMAMVPIIHKELNKFLATFSPSVSGHIEDLDIHLIRGAYSFEGVTAKIKKDNKQFLQVDEIDVSIAWRELFKGKILTDIKIAGMDLNYMNTLPDALKQSAKKDEEKAAKDKLFPVKVERLEIEDSKIVMEDYREITGGKPFMVANIDGSITNLTPTEKNNLSFFNLKGMIMGASALKTAGTLNMVAKPMAWNLDSELQSLDLTTLNQFLRRKVPLTFTQGKLDLYAEAKSQNGKIEGYVKPFMKNLDIVKSDEDFKGPKHWLIEIATAVGNLILRASDTKTVATKVPFTYDGKFSVDSGKAVSKAIEHGFEQQLSPGIENKIDMK